MSKGKSAQDLGDLGEAEFRLWCTRNALICNGSNPDRMGWDFLVELPEDLQRGVPLDRQNDLKKAFVQVKSTRNDPPVYRAKLSALKNLVDADVPAFIICIQFDVQNRVKAARLLHVDLDMIATVLRKVRASEAKGLKKIHDRQMLLPLEQGAAIQSNGSNLRQELESYLGASSAEYIKAKILARETCGYEGAIKATFSIEATGDELADFLIGRIPELSVRTGSIEQRRFDIVLPSDIKSVGKGVIQIGPNPSEVAKMTFHHGVLGLHVEIPVTMRSTAPARLPRKLQRLRLNNDCVDAEFKLADRSFELKFLIPCDEQYELRELTRRLRIGYLLAQEGTTLKIEASGLSPINIDMPHAISELADQTILYEFADRIGSTLEKYRPSNIIQVSFADVATAFATNRMMFSVLTRPGFKVTIANKLVEKAGEIWRVVFVLPVILSLKTWSYAAVAVAEGRWSKLADGSIEAVGGQPQIIWDSIGNNQNFVPMVSQRVRACADNQIGKNVMVVTASLQNA